MKVTWPHEIPVHKAPMGFLSNTAHVHSSIICNITVHFLAMAVFTVCNRINVLGAEADDVPLSLSDFDGFYEVKY